MFKLTVTLELSPKLERFIMSSVEEVKSMFTAKIDEIKATIQSETGEVQTAISSLKETLGAKIDELQAKLDASQPVDLVTEFAEINSSLSELGESVSNIFVPETPIV